MHIIILGNGIAGITAARFIRKWSNHSITVISGETDYFFSRTALMYVYMGHLRFQDTQPYEAHFWKKNRIELVQAWVDAIDVNARKLQLRDGRALTYDKLIIATGSLTNKFGWPGQELGRVQGLYHRQDLESMEAATPHVKNAVVVGGGLIGIEMAEMFHSKHIPVTMLVREKSYWNGVLPAEESEMINRHIRDHGIDLRLSTELREIADDGTGNAGAVVTNTGEQIACQFVGLTAGVRPNVDMLRDSGIEIGRGVLVNDHLQTNQPDVYAIGDCAELRTPKPGRRAIEAVWYVGRMMGETAALNICRTPVEYDPGIWFNSAKFFDIEYQVYGDVPTEYEHTGKTSWYRESGCGRRSVRIVYDQATERVLGFNLMGTRFRQEVCQHWISSGALLKTVLRDLQQATFDPEFQASL
jgi:NADPH-dependent 2,4-dienoyl-CoA reductase/sulfur reductase-like enzyme